MESDIPAVTVAFAALEAEKQRRESLNRVYVSPKPLMGTLCRVLPILVLLAVLTCLPTLERPINDLCISANHVYRERASKNPAATERAVASVPDGQLPALTGLALRSAAMQAGESEAMKRIASRLQDVAPDVWRALGFTAS